MKKICYTILLCLTICSIFFFDKYKQNVFAVTNGDYNRVPPGGDITLADWNFLDEDILQTDGGNTMDNNLNNGTKRIIGLGASQNQADVANIDFVKKEIVDKIANIQGGDTYVNWGRGDCAAGDTVLYSGYGFGNYFSNSSGGDNEICISMPYDGSVLNSGTITDSLYPLMTGEAVFFPTTGTTYKETTAIKCALCYKEKSSCYTNIGTHDCESTGFTNKAYQGYLAGELSNLATYKTTSQNTCLNMSYDNGGSTLSLDGSIWRAATIGENFGLTAYSKDRFVKCSVCCK